MELFYMNIYDLHELLKKREISSLELTETILKRIENIEPKINAYITIVEDVAISMAKKADKRISQNEMTFLTGIPIGIKDVICTEGIRTTCASHILENFYPPYNATSIEKLLSHDPVFLGKTNMDEFAMGSSTENSYFGNTKNPWNLAYIPGGSSGGSAAAVASGECIAALGSDTGGSIRQPASHCGVTGLKPTYGRVSRYGLVAYASSLDQIGPITRDVRDAAILFSAIAGWDSKDSTSQDVAVPTDIISLIENPVKGLKIGLPKEYFIEGLDPDVNKALEDAISIFKDLGIELVDISLPHTEYVVATYYIIAPAEASSNLARYDGVKYGFRVKDTNNLLEMYEETRSLGFGPEVIRRIILGTYVLSAGYYDAYYRKASQVRTLIMQDFLEAFEKCDIILTPVSPTPAFKLGEKVSDPLQMYLTDIFTLSANLAGLPGLSIPCGLSKEGLPIGLQLIGKHFEEETILRAGHQFQQETDFHKRHPEV